jgi:hypothetical protein
MNFNGAMTNDLHSYDCPHSLDIELSKMSMDASNHSLVVFWCCLLLEEKVAIGGELY